MHISATHSLRARILGRWVTRGSSGIEGLGQEEGMWSVVAKPERLEFSPQTVISSGIELYLRRRKMFSKLVVCIALFFKFSLVFALFGEARQARVEVRDGVFHDHTTIRYGVAAQTFYSVQAIILAWLMYHRINKNLLRLVVTEFDSLFIFAHFLITEITRGLSEYSLFRSVYDWEWAAAHILNTVSMTPLATIVCCVDAARAPKLTKFFILSLTIAHWFNRFMSAGKDLGIFSDYKGHECIMQLPCAQLRNSYRASCATIAIFVGKACVNLRKPFSILRPHYDKVAAPKDLPGPDMKDEHDKGGVQGATEVEGLDRVSVREPPVGECSEVALAMPGAQRNLNDEVKTDAGENGSLQGVLEEENMCHEPGARVSLGESSVGEFARCGYLFANTIVEYPAAASALAAILPDGHGLLQFVQAAQSGTLSIALPLGVAPSSEAELVGLTCVGQADGPSQSQASNTPRTTPRTSL